MSCNQQILQAQILKNMVKRLWRRVKSMAKSEVQEMRFLQVLRKVTVRWRNEITSDTDGGDAGRAFKIS